MLASGGSRILVLDYEGTLVPFAPLPELGTPDEGLRSLLAALARRPDTDVHVTSGAPRALLFERLGGLGLTLHAESGAFRRSAPSDRWYSRVPVNDRMPWRTTIADHMSSVVRLAPGSFVEEKAASVAWHYRLAEPDHVEHARAVLEGLIAEACQRYDLEYDDASCAFDVRFRAIHKGLVVRDAIARRGSSALVIAAGDDATDERMFAELPSRGLGVFTGRGDSRASHRLSGPRELRELLARLALEPEHVDVLVVEDQPNLRALVLEVLSSEGLTALGVGDGSTALDWLSRAGRRPQLMITDIEMPRMGGCELIARMRKDQALGEIAIIVMTGAGEVPAFARDIAVLRKPCPVELLLSTVRRALGRAP